jgi:hypothetical protein
MNAVYSFQKSPRCSATSKRTKKPCQAPEVTAGLSADSTAPAEAVRGADATACIASAFLPMRPSPRDEFWGPPAELSWSVKKLPVR